MDDKKLVKLEALLKLVDESINKEEFVSSFENVLKHVFDIEKKLVQKISDGLNEVKKLFNDLKDNNQSELSAFKNETQATIDNALKDQADGLNFIRDKVRGLENGRDGKDAEEEKIIKEVLAQIPEQKEIILDTPEQLRDKLETLNDNEKLKIEAINGLEEKLKELETRPVGKGGGGFNYGAMDIHIVDDETPTNTGDDLNFTISHAPSPVSSLKVFRNGQRLKLTSDYTFTGNTITLLVALGAGEILTVDYRI